MPTHQDVEEELPEHQDQPENPEAELPENPDTKPPENLHVLLPEHHEGELPENPQVDLPEHQQENPEAEYPTEAELRQNLEADLPETIVETDKGSHQHSLTGDLAIAELPENPEAKRTENPEAELPENLEAEPETIVKPTRAIINIRRLVIRQSNYHFVKRLQNVRRSSWVARGRHLHTTGSLQRMHLV